MNVDLVTDDMAMRIATRSLALSAAKEAFVSVWEGKAARFPVLAGSGLNDGEVINLKFGNDSTHQLVGFKAGSYWPRNEAAGRSNHAATTFLFDPNTGYLSAIINTSSANRLRTAAADAVAVQVLSRPDAAVLAIIGTGRQAEHEVRAVCDVRQIQEIHVVGRSDDRAAQLVERLDAAAAKVVASNAEQAVRDADIIITVTNAQQPVLRREWVKPGAHISAMGADQRGKNELDPALLPAATLFADDPQQALVVGELQWLAEGAKQKIHSIGEVLSTGGYARSEDEITIFDSSGLAAQDLSIAHAILECARRQGLCATVAL